MPHLLKLESGKSSVQAARPHQFAVSNRLRDRAGMLDGAKIVIDKLRPSR